MFRFSIAVVAGLAAVSPVSAGWAEGLFEEVSKDFGSVPRGPTLTHTFAFTNKTNAPVQVTGVRVSCGCVTATVVTPNLAPGQTGSILAQMDTRRFVGHKSVTIYVQFSQPQFEEAHLVVQAYGRDDVSVTPETLSFGQVARGSAATAEATVALIGGAAGAIREVRTDSNYVSVVVTPVSNDNGQQTYKVAAKVRPDLPVGNWTTDVWLGTDNAGTPRIRVPLTVTVEVPLTVSPGNLALGQVKQGAPAERKLVLRGTKPFKVLGVDGAQGQVAIKDGTTDSKQVHVVTLALTPKQAGDQKWNLTIRTDLPADGTVDVQAQAVVVP